jgi:hypothetical protein
MKSERTRTPTPAKNSKMSRIHPQKIAPAFLAAQTHSLLQQPVRAFSSPIESWGIPESAWF